MGEWSATTIGKVTTLVTKGTTPPKGKGFVDVGVNYIKSDSLSYDRPIDTSLFVAIDYETHRLFKRSQIEASDILFSMAGAFLGKSGMAEASMLPANTNQAVAIIRPDQNIVEPLFLGLFFRQKSIIEFVNNLSGQSAQPNINFQEIKSIELMLPELPEQRAIASVLSSLDAKIDLLHRQNKTLEAMAETLFRQWFVERRPEDLEGEAEEGWEEGTLSALGPIEMGNSPKGDSYNEVGEGVPLINGPVEYGVYFPLRSKWTTDPKRFAEAGDLIFCVRGSTTGRRVVADGEYAIGRGVCAFRSKQRMFLYQMIEAKLPDLLAQTTGSVFPSLSSDDIKNFPITLPPQKLRDQYEELAGPMLELIEFNHRQCTTLAALRDTLLPKLMSGEVRVEEGTTTSLK